MTALSRNNELDEVEKIENVVWSVIGLSNDACDRVCDDVEKAPKGRGAPIDFLKEKESR